MITPNTSQLYLPKMTLYYCDSWFQKERCQGYSLKQVNTGLLLMKRRKKTIGIFLQNVLILKAISKYVIIILLFGEEKHLKMPFFKDFISFIIRHIGKNLHILKKIENGSKTDIFLIKKYVINMLYQMLKWLLFCKITINRAELWHTSVNSKYWKYSCFEFYKNSDL